METRQDITWFLILYCQLKMGQKVFAGDVLARLPKETSKTKRYYRWFARVAELFEARRPKDSADCRK